MMISTSCKILGFCSAHTEDLCALGSDVLLDEQFTV
jgi:hypothetical protein